MISQAAPVFYSEISAPVTTKAETVLNTDQLVKIYGGRAVVNGVNMNVSAGEIVGCWPNGAGKTTSFYMIVDWLGQQAVA